MPNADLIRHTIVVRPSRSYCGNCGANVFPGSQTTCKSCSTTFTYSATNTVGDQSLAEYAAQFQQMWPDLRFIGVAAQNYDWEPGDPQWMLVQQWAA
jgi:hypothetical protein